MIPGPIITMLVSAILGFIFKTVDKNQEIRLAEHKARMAEYDQQAKTWKDVLSISVPGFSWTRRMIVAVCLSYLFIGRFYVACKVPEIPIMMGYMEEGCRFLFWGGMEKMKFKTLTGYTILPLDVHACMAIIGLYFGGRTKS